MLVGEPRVLLPSRLFLVARAFPRIGYRQRGREHQYLADTALGVGLQDHPAHARIERQPGQPAADVGQGARGVECTELLQQLDPVADAASVWRVQEWKLPDVTELQGGHLQDDRGQVGPQDLRIGVAGPGFEVFLRVQPDAHTRSGTSRASGPLSGRGLRDRLDRQPLHLGAAAVAGDPRSTRVDDVADAGHRE